MKAERREITEILVARKEFRPSMERSAKSRNAVATATLFLLLSTATASNPENALHRSARFVSSRMRGGATQSPFELNPNYEPLPGRHTPSFMAKQQSKEKLPPPAIPEIYYQAQSFNTSPPVSDLQSAKNSFIQYLSALHKKCPSLYYTTIACATIFILWQIPFFQPLLQKHFVCSKRNIAAGRILCLVLSEISHVSFVHLLVNMSTLHSFGPTVRGALKSTTNWPVWPLMLGTALAGSVAHLAFGKRDGCVGISDITLAFLAMYARMFPTKVLSLYIMGVFPVQMSAGMLLRALIIWSIIGCFSARSNISHVSHLAGLLCGMGFHELWQTRRLAMTQGFLRRSKLN